MSFHQKFVRSCKNPHVGQRRETSMRALYNSHRSCFESYVPPKELTERQKLLLDGKHPNPCKREVSTLLRKLKYHGRYEDVKRVLKQYEHFYRETHCGDPTLEKALITLRNMLPNDLKLESVT